MNEIEFLKENKKFLEQADRGYVTGLTTGIILKFKEIYTKKMGEHINSINCPSCVLTMLKKIYDKYKNELE